MIKVKKAFSLIEVIFVLVILGIVASISSQIIVQVYENYITQKALYTTSSKTEMAINQIVNRLTFSIENTTITKDPLSTIAYTKASEGTNWIRLKNIDVNLSNSRRYTSIEWIGYDNDGFSATEAPHWSGIADYDDNITATTGGFTTPGSRLDLAGNVIDNLSNGKVKMDGGGTLPAVIFSDEYYLGNAPLGIIHDPACMGLIDETNTTCISRVQRNNNTSFTFPDAKQKKITERYKLAWSAYALVPEEIIKDGKGTGLFNLFLYSNYQPWNNENYEDDGDKNLLINNVSVFKFTENGGVIQIKLCASADIGERNATNEPVYISSCKEKAIIK